MIRGLPAGEYLLRAPGLPQVTITVLDVRHRAAGRRVHRGRGRRAVAARAGDRRAVDDRRAARSSCAPPTPRTRVHVLATRFAPALLELPCDRPARASAAAPTARAARSTSRAASSATSTATCSSAAARSGIPALLLDKPSLLLNPWSRRTTTTDVATRAAGRRVRAPRPRRRRPRLRRRAAARRRPPPTRTRSSSYDFLADAARRAREPRCPTPSGVVSDPARRARRRDVA